MFTYPSQPFTHTSFHFYISTQDSNHQSLYSGLSSNSPGKARTQTTEDMDGSTGPAEQAGISLVSLLVHSYDEAIAFFTQKLGFTLTEDSPALTNDGRAKRWVVVHPPSTTGAGAGAGILLARADGPAQEQMVGNQFAGRVGLFWRTADFEGTYARLVEAGVRFVAEPRAEAYGRVAVFVDVSGNKWDLLG
ncbi:Glyoxalase-like domain-containing protein [Cladophialophora immunda]|nr:Glyoxalase-like domain-containing protein [Cladophialophora immunda]